MRIGYLSGILCMLNLASCIWPTETEKFHRMENAMAIYVYVTSSGNKCADRSDTLMASAGSNFGPFSSYSQCFRISATTGTSVSASSADSSDDISMYSWEPYDLKTKRGTVTKAFPDGNTDIWIQIRCSTCTSWTIQF